MGIPVSADKVSDRLRPILLGRRAVIERKIQDMGLRIDLTDGVHVLDPAQDDDVFGPLLHDFQLLVGKEGDAGRVESLAKG